MADAGQPGGAAGIALRIGDPRSVALEALERGTLLNLRASPERADVLEAIAEVIGHPLPTAVNRWQGEADRFAARLGPDEWLLKAPAGHRERLEADLAGLLETDERGSVCDVSHNYAAFLLRGPRARDVLAKGCPLDLHPDAFRPGHGAQTLLAAASVLLRCVEAGDIELRVRNSFARYTVAWLEDAMAEF